MNFIKNHALCMYGMMALAMDSRDVLITSCCFYAITLAIGCSAKAVPGATFLAPEILQVDTPENAAIIVAQYIQPPAWYGGEISSVKITVVQLLV